MTTHVPAKPDVAEDARQTAIDSYLKRGRKKSFAIAGLLVVFLIAYHLYCGRLMRAFAEGRNTRSHVWYRYFNEIPVLVLFVVVFLVVLKPF